MTAMTRTDTSQAEAFLEAAYARLIEASRFAAEAVWLVCDGVPRGASRVGRIVIEGAGPRRKADDHIADIVGRSSAPRRVMVVTSECAGVIDLAFASSAITLIQ